MKIIPVLDLMNGIVVHAVRGRREAYGPVRSRLCQDPDPFAVIDSFLRFYPFDAVYLADLDALMGGSRQRLLIDELRAAYPSITFWVDEGMPDPVGMVTGSRIPVIGSESLDTAGWRRLRASHDWILSLDFFDGRLRGPWDILDQPEAWPERVIVMSLNRVGSFDGPDLDGVSRVRDLAPSKKLIAAGGIRHDGDLEALESQGVHAVLVASALHSGALELSRFGRTVP